MYPREVLLVISRQFVARIAQQTRLVFIDVGTH
jgi:hypothetical protein